MKAGTLLQDVEGLALIAGLGIAAYLVYQGYTTAKKIGNTGTALADKVSQVYTTAKTKAADAVTQTEVAVKQLLNPGETVQLKTPEGADAAAIRRDAVSLLGGLRTANEITKTLPQNVIPSLWGDFTDWYSADTTGKAVRDAFYSKNPEGVFYD